ncbi:MAG: hypothetical protein FJ090_16255 [Deltaproteobacteria bacterium]|nr:hypothetical protein [Deltaproteobacteria bacterium]
MKRALAALLVLALAGGAAWRFTREAPAPSPAVEVDADGFVTLAKPPWGAKRLRYCTIIERALRPESAGQRVLTEFILREGEGAVFREFHFRDESGAHTLSATAAGCLSSATVDLDTGQYRWQFTVPTEPVGRDEALDAVAGADPSVRRCLDARPGDEPVTVAVVVDADGTTWASDGTSENESRAHCVAEAAKLAVDAQPPVGPAAVIVTVP